MDLFTIETYQNTEIATLGIWDPHQLDWPNRGDHGFKLVNEEFRVSDFGVLVNTSADGNFKVLIHLNQQLSEWENNVIDKEIKGIKLKVEGTLRIGDPGYSGEQDKIGVEDNWLDNLELPSGNYIIDIYTLIIKSGESRYRNIAYCIFLESKYPQQT